MKQIKHLRFGLFQCNLKFYFSLLRILILEIIFSSLILQSGTAQSFDINTSIPFDDTQSPSLRRFINASYGDLLTSPGFELLFSTWYDPGGRGLGIYFSNNLISRLNPTTLFPTDDRGIYSTSLVDYNNDGNLDLFATNDGTVYAAIGGGNILKSYPTSMLLRNNGNNTFTRIPNKIVNVADASHDWKDYDNDGDYDLIISGNNLNLGKITKIYRNEKNDNFTEVFSSSQYTGSVLWWDYDKDGVYDCIIGNKIFRNNRAVGFQYIDSLPATQGYIALGDIDADGDFDVVSGYQVMRKNNNSYSVISNLDTINARNSFADYDNDGDLDLLHGSTIYNNTGGTFTKTSYNWFTNGQWMDYDGDSDLDVFSVSGTGRVYLNSGIPDTPPAMPDSLKCTIINDKVTFTWNKGSDTQTASNGLTYNLFVGTYSNVGDIVSPMSDIATGARKINNFGNMGQSRSWTLENLPEGKYYWGVQTIDNSFLSSGFNTGQSFVIEKFTPVSFVGDDSEMSALDSKMHLFDIDSDDDIDILYSEPNAGVTRTIVSTRNMGAGLFTVSYLLQTPDINETSNIYDVHDANKDGQLDVFISSTSGNVVRLYDGKNKTIDTIGIPVIGQIAVGDFNNDGNEDVSIDKYIFRNNGNLSYSAVDTLSVNGEKSWIDFDNDYDLDLLAGDNLYRNDNGNFTLHTTILGANICHAWCDIDNDGDMDIAASNKIYLNTNGNFLPINLTFSDYPGKRVCWADFDNNGYSDLLYLNRSPQILLLLYNEGNNIFSPYELKIPVVNQLAGTEIAPADIDNDGDMDFALIGYYSTTNHFFYRYFYINNTSKFNTAPGAPGSLSSHLDKFDMILTWLASTDPESSGKGLSYNIRVGTSPGGFDIISSMSDNANGYRRIPEMGNVQGNLGWRLKNLPEGRYYWSVQAIDQEFKGSAWAPEQTFEISRVSANFAVESACEGTPNEFHDLSLATGGNVDGWKWYFGDGDSSNVQDPQHIYADGGVFNVTLKAFSGGFQNSIIKSLTVKHKPIAAFTAQPECERSKTSFISDSNLSNIYNPQWKWNFGDGEISSNAGSVDHLYLTSADFKASLLITADNGCSDSIQKFVMVSAYPNEQISSSSLSFCTNEGLIMSVTDNPDYTYSWMLNNNYINNSNSNIYVANITGIYSAEITNIKGPCKQTTRQVSITKNEMPAIPVIIPQNYEGGKCPGETPVVLTIDQPVLEYSYQWKRNGTPISNETSSSLYGIWSAGEYSVTASLSGCITESARQTIIFNDVPPKPLIYVHGPNVWYLACSNSTAEQYKWYYNDELITGEDKYIYVANQKLGNYYVTIKNDAGCYASSDIIKIPVDGISIVDQDPFAGLTVYPNPNSGQFTVEIDNKVFGQIMISVLDQRGMEVFRTKSEKTSERFTSQINLRNKSKGIYLINLNLNGQTLNRKIIIEQ